jgi:hypothetical protein
MQRAFNPGEISKMIGVSTSLIVKWIDQGKLRGYKIPFTSRRKVTARDLEQFCKDHGLSHLFEPLRPIGKKIKRRTVLLCGFDPSLIKQLAPYLEEVRVDSLTVANTFDLMGLAVNKKVIGVAVDLAIGKTHAIEAGMAMAGLKRELQRVALLYAQPEDNDPIYDAYNIQLQFPFHPQELAEMLTLGRRGESS